MTDFLITFRVGRVERHVHKIDFAFEFGNNVALIDQIALPVGVQARFHAFFMSEIGNGDHFVHFIRRLAEAAEYEFFIRRQIFARQRGDHLFRRGIAVTDPKVISVVTRPLVTHAEFAAVRAFVREIDIHVAVEFVYIGIFAVFVVSVYRPRVAITVICDVRGAVFLLPAVIVSAKTIRIVSAVIVCRCRVAVPVLPVPRVAPVLFLRIYVLPSFAAKILFFTRAAAVLYTSRAAVCGVSRITGLPLTRRSVPAIFAIPIFAVTILSALGFAVIAVFAAETTIISVSAHNYTFILKKLITYFRIQATACADGCVADFSVNEKIIKQIRRARKKAALRFR